MSSARTTRELGRKERSLIVVVALYRREHGCGPSYSRLSRELDLDREKGAYLIRRLHRDGFLVSIDEPHSLDVTSEGLRAALRKDGRR